MKMAQDADLDLDDDLKHEVNSKLSGKKRLAIQRGDLAYDEMLEKGERPDKQRKKED